MYRASNLKSIRALDKELEEVKLEKDRLDGKLAGLLKASKNLDHLIESQRAPRNQERVRKESYGQRSKAEEKSSKALMAIDGVGWDWSYMANEEDHALVADGKAPIEFALMTNNENEDEKDLFDGKLARLLKSSKDLEDIIESQTSEKVKEGLGYNVVPPPAADLYLSPKKDLSWTGLPEFVDDTVADYSRPLPTVASTPAEDQNNDTSTSEETASTNPSKPFIKFVKPKDSQPESKIEEQETPKKPQVKNSEQNRQSNRRPKGNQRNWNNLKSYQLGPEFVLHKKPCFNCGDFSHLAKDCRRRVQRETNRPHGPSMNPRRPTMNGANRSQNHSYKSSTYRSAGHRPNGAHMRPPLRSSGPRPHGDSMRPPFRPAGHRPHGPSMNPRRPTMNGARPYKTFFQTPSFKIRPFLKSSAVNNSYRAPWVPTINRAVPKTTLMTKAIGTVAALGTWQATYPTSFILSHLMEDMCLLVKEDARLLAREPLKPNSILFTDSECIMLGRDFKLLDDANILLRTPRQHNMYSIDLNNIVPHRDLTCLVAKASADEYILWHKRLGHLNVKTMNKLGEYNTDFHHMEDFIAASPLRYALTVKPTVFVSHIRQFWSTARIETTDEGTQILATVDGIQRTVSKSSLRRNLKLRDADGISSLP
nr:ribonuclease H-like domain-containing protein [Tanacetum cinerariifolium]